MTREMTQRRPIWMLAGGAIALGLLAWGVTHAIGLSQAQSQRSVVPPPPTQEKIVALGRLEPEGEVIRVGGPTGDRIARLEVDRGAGVKAGQILAYLESHQEREAERDLAASQLAEAEQRLQAATDYGTAQIATAQTRLVQIDKPAAFEIEAQEATIRKLDAELALAQQDLQRFQKLQGEGATTKQSLDRQASQTQQLQEQLNNAKATLIRLQASRSVDVANAGAQLAAQQANLPLTQIQVATASARQNLKLAEARWERTVIRAPRDGRVLRVITRAGEAIGNDGILDLGNTNQMYAVAEVAETDLAKVKVGQFATIKSRNGAFDKPLKGKVAEIGWQIFKNNVLDDDPAANADARVVEVKIRLDESKAVATMTNLQVDVNIDLKR